MIDDWGISYEMALRFTSQDWWRNIGSGNGLLLSGNNNQSSSRPIPRRQIAPLGRNTLKNRVAKRQNR